MKFKEIEEIVRNWEETNLLEGFEDKISIATCLQAQLKLNEQESEPQFKRISIPLIIRILSESKAAKRNYFYNYFEEEDKPAVVIFKSKHRSFEPKDLDEEAEYTAKLATDIKSEIDSLFSDTMNKDIIFHGLRCLDDGHIAMAYN